MNTSKIIKGVVSNGRYTVTAPIVKEDYGLYLKIEGVELPETYQVDFSNSENSGTSVTMIGNADGVLIPRQFISTGKDVFAFLYHVGEDFGRTVYKFRIPNKVRPDRTNEEPTPEEQSVIDQAISALNEAVAQTAQDVVDADASAQSASADAERAEEARTDAQNYATQAEQSATDAQESASQASASASASAQSASQSAQIKADVEDLAEEAQGYAQSAEASSQNAHTYALSANIASSTAENFADVASGYASSAQTSANTASAKAQDASQSATTASQKATEAAQSATNASQSAQTAESAKTASQTAQGGAESARDDAVQAKSDVQDLADGIDTRLVDVEADVIKAFPTDTSTGAIASFTDGADNLPLKSLVVDINPIQDLSHGDPSPENICPISGWTQVEVNHSDDDTTNPTTITIDLGQAVYGGKLDVLTGELVVDRVHKTYNGTENWNASNLSDPVYYALWNQDKSIGNQDMTQIADWLVAGGNDYQRWGTYRAQTNGAIVVGNLINKVSGNYKFADASEFKAYLAEHPLTVCYKIATPITYQLTPNEVNSLLGVNNIFADTGDTEVEYRADPDLYIQQKMPEVPVDDVQINGQSIVSDGVANVPIASNSNLGAIKSSSYGGIIINENGELLTNRPIESVIKGGGNAYRPIVSDVQHISAFYGLAKVAGHDEKNSTLALGTYSEDAKIAIQKMLGLYREWELIADVTVEEDSVQIDITTDSSGQSFALREAFVRVWLNPSTTGANDYVSAKMLCEFNNGIVNVGSLPTLRYMANGAKTFMEYKAELIDGIGRAVGSATSSPSTTGTLNRIDNEAVDIKHYYGFRIGRYSSSTTLIPAGTIIKIYGIRA